MKNKKITIIIIAVVSIPILAFVFFLHSNKRLYKHFLFTKATCEMPDVQISAKLIGKEILLENGHKESILGSPYELLIGFTPASKEYTSVEISELELTTTKNTDPTNTQIVICKKENIKRVYQARPGGYYSAYLSLENLQLEHRDHILRIKLLNVGNDSTIEHEIILHLRKKYQEYYSNDFWDAISSV